MGCWSAPSDGGGFPVPGIDHRGVGKREQLTPDALEEGVVVAPGEIAAADRACKQHVPAQHQAVSHETDMSGRVPRRVPHLELGRPEAKLLSVGQMMVGGRRLAETEPDPEPLLGSPSYRSRSAG